MSGSIPATDGSVIITFEYNDADVDGVGPGLAWCILHDNPVLGWNTTTPVTPIIIGSMPAAPPATDPVLSPAWGKFFEGTVFLPDLWRGNPAAMFTHLANNNGAKRKIYANFYSEALASQWRQWAQMNPTLALSEPPNVTAAREEEEARAEAEAKEAEAKAAAAEAKEAADAAAKAKSAADASRKPAHGAQAAHGNKS